jgi:hypothetical protein
MNRLSIVVLLGVTIVSSMVLGAATTIANYKVLPSTPISINPQQTDEVPSVKNLTVTSLMTAGVVMYPHPHLNSSSQTEFKQWEIMGIYLGYACSWINMPLLVPNSSSIQGQNYEDIYFGGKLSAHIITTLEIHNAGGQLVANIDNLNMLSGGGSGEGTSRRTYYIQVSSDWNPGTYTVKFYVEDLLTASGDSMETTVNILAGQPPQEKHPSPIATDPADMIVGLADLPEGWAIARGDSSASALDNFVAVFEREFSRAVGEFKHVFSVRIEQYENIEAANQSYQSKLEGALSNQRYGHGQVVVKDIADGGFLYDNTERRSPDWRGWDVDGGNLSSWATGSWVVFREENIVVAISDVYNYGAICQGVFLTPDQLVEFARIQAAKIPSS